MYEQGMKFLRVYDGTNMKLLRDIKCEASILQVEAIPDRNMICVALSNTRFVFYDAGVASKPEPYGPVVQKVIKTHKIPLT